MVRLFAYLRRFHPAYNHPRLNPNALYNVLKPDSGSPPEAHRIRKYINDRLSDLTSLLEDFLVSETVKNNPEKKDELLRESLLSHNHFDLFSKKTKAAINKLESNSTQETSSAGTQPLLSGEQLLQRWYLKYALFKHPQVHSLSEKGNDLLDTMDDLDSAYAIFKMRYGLHELSRQDILEGTRKVPLLNEITDRFADSPNIIFKLYRIITKCFTAKRTLPHWDKAFNLLLTHKTELPFEEKLTLFTALINLGHRIAQRRVPKHFLRLFELYRLGFDEGIWTHGHTISSITFMNITTLGATTAHQLPPTKAKAQLRWLEHFITKSANHLSGKDKSNVLLYAKAQLAFANGLFAKAYYDYLEKMELQDLSDKLVYRLLRAKCLYELRSSDPRLEPVLSSFLDSFYNFVQRKKLSPARKQYYYNFIKFLRKINKPDEQIKINQVYKAELCKELKNAERIAAYDWLCDKINAL